LRIIDDYLNICIGKYVFKYNCHLLVVAIPINLLKHLISKNSSNSNVTGMEYFMIIYQK